LAKVVPAVSISYVVRLDDLEKTPRQRMLTTDLVLGRFTNTRNDLCISLERKEYAHTIIIAHPCPSMQRALELFKRIIHSLQGLRRKSMTVFTKQAIDSLRYMSIHYRYL